MIQTRTEQALSGGYAIEAHGLTKIFLRGRRTMMQRLRRTQDRREQVAAVDGIELEVARGEIFGLLGPNGAGKTTTLRMLATLLEPTSGDVSILGIDLARRPREVRGRLGAVLSGERSLYWKLTARENLEYFAALYHLPWRETGVRIQSILEEVDLADRADDYVERFSTGMRQRLVLARALLPDPALLLVDEPTVGLDPQAAIHIRERITRLRAQGRTVLITTHDMEEADQMCDRIAIIDGGRIVALGTPGELKRSIRSEQVVHLQVAPGGSAGGFANHVGAAVTVAEQHHVDGVLSMTLHCASAPEFVPAAFQMARDDGVVIKHVEIVPVTLEEVFLALTGKALRE